MNKLKKTSALGATLLLMTLNIASTQNASAQSLLDFFKKEEVKDVISDVASDYIDFNIVGRWTYKGSAIKVDSGDVIKDLTASAASSTIESNINSYLEKVGIEPEKMSFVFNEDKTLEVVLPGRTVKGTYEYNKETKKVTFNFAKIIPVTANVEVANTTFDILFKIDGLIKVVQGISSSMDLGSLESIVDLLSKYEGMFVGFSFDREGGSSLSNIEL